MQKVMQLFGAPLFFMIFNGLRHEVGSLSRQIKAKGISVLLVPFAAF
ncbi:hypothetical protein [Shewanella sp. SW24]|nr:hypothetical protein [Shewanella sp. SW24]MCU7985587.1 hypothetical protein [Shewanella sp. SW24]